MTVPGEPESPPGGRLLFGGPPSTSTDPVRRALDHGEPGRALQMLDRAAQPGPDATGLREVAHFLRDHWGPGPVGFDSPDHSFARWPRGEAADLTVLVLAMRQRAMWAGRAPDAGTVCEDMLGSLRRWHDASPGLGPSLQLQAATISRLCGRPDPAPTYTGDDPWTAASWELECGDALFSRFATPETLGIDITSGDLHGFVSGAEGRVAAAGHYDRAAALTGPSARLDLRRGALLIVELRHAEAADLLAVAHASASGSERALLAVHLLIARALAGRLEDLHDGVIEELVRWGSGPGSRSYVLGGATLMRGVARSAIVSGLPDRGRALLDAARSVCHGVSAVATEIRVASDLAWFYGQVNAAGAGVATVEESLARWRDVPPGVPSLLVWISLGRLLADLGRLVLAEGDERALVRLGVRVSSLATDELSPPEDERLVERCRELAAGIRVDLLAVARSLDVMARLVSALDADEPDPPIGDVLDLADHPPDGAEPDPRLAIFVLLVARRKELLCARLEGGVPDGIDVDHLARAWLVAGRPDEARRALEAADAVEPPPSEDWWLPRWEQCELRAAVAFGCKQQDRAGDLALEGIARFEKWFLALTGDAVRVAALDMRSVRDLYDVAVRIAVAEEDAASALTVADRTRWLALGSLAAEVGSGGRIAPAVLRRREAEATWNGMFDERRAALGRPGRSGRALSERDLAAARRDLDLAVSAAPAPREPVDFLDSSAVVAALPPDALLVHYTITDDELVIVTATAAGSDVGGAPVTRRTVNGLARKALGAWSRGDPRQDPALESVLLDPLRHLLEHHRRVIVVPDGALNAIPFAGLELGGAPMLTRWTLSQLPSAALLPRLTGVSRPRLERESVAVGDPDKMDPLPAARVEALIVGRLLRASVLVGEDATETSTRTALAAAGGVIHLATHGRLNTYAPDLTSLAMADGKALTVAELIGLGLDTDLAVLSACNSGQGEITRGGDVVGLARGMLAAGARHVLMTMWPVDDVAACVTMVDFTERIVAGEDVAEALAGAQRTVRLLPRAEQLARVRALAAETGVTPDPSWRARGGPALIRGGGTSGTPTDGDHRLWAPFVHLGV